MFCWCIRIGIIEVYIIYILYIFSAFFSAGIYTNKLVKTQLHRVFNGICNLELWGFWTCPSSVILETRKHNI
jgi:hypothetical protein